MTQLKSCRTDARDIDDYAATSGDNIISDPDILRRAAFRRRNVDRGFAGLRRDGFDGVANHATFCGDNIY